ncbi:MAG TPA: hypothetical protein VF765_38505 [Polyangiaceae bacterium]
MRPLHLCLAALAASAVLDAPVVAHAKTPGFEGRISLRLQDVAPSGADYSIRGNRVSIDVPSVGHAHDLRIVFDSARLPSAAGAVPDVAIERTGGLRSVVGQRCEVWVLRGGADTVRACVVPGVAWVDPRRVVGGDVPAWSQRLEKEQAFPVSVTHGANASWATDVTRGRVPGSAFAAPAATRAR